MDVDLGLLGLSVLLLILAGLLIIGRYEKKPSAPVKTPPNDRRASPRYKASLRIKYTTPLKEGISWIGDISESGAQLFLNDALRTLKIGEPLGIEINLPSETQPVVVKGNIVWAKEDNAGFNFNMVLQGDINRVIHYISSQNQA